MPAATIVKRLCVEEMQDFTCAGGLRRPRTGATAPKHRCTPCRTDCRQQENDAAGSLGLNDFSGAAWLLVLLEILDRTCLLSRSCCNAGHGQSSTPESARHRGATSFSVFLRSRLKPPTNRTDLLQTSVNASPRKIATEGAAPCRGRIGRENEYSRGMSCLTASQPEFL